MLLPVELPATGGSRRAVSYPSAKCKVKAEQHHGGDCALPVQREN